MVVKIVHLEGTCINCKIQQTKSRPLKDYEKFGQDLECGKCKTPISFEIKRIEEEET